MFQIDSMLAFARGSVSKRKRKVANRTSRWDSSDPERAPPPLPLNPGSGTPQASPTKPNTSATVAAAAQALVERARENLASPYTINPPPERLGDRAATWGAQHKRLQSLQNGSTREFKGHSGSASEKTESRPTTPTSSKELQLTSPEQLLLQSGSPTPTQSSRNEKEKSRARPLPRPLMRENTPPSATMLALKNMSVPEGDLPLGDITNGATPRSIEDFERIHAQMKDLTTIANALQSEMTALSKRSRDNASDLMALKRATSSRDEDIKKSLRELVSSRKNSEQGLLLPPPRSEMSRPASALSLPQHILDHKPLYSPPLHKAASMPRVPTTHDTESHADSTRAPSPLPFSIDSTSSIAMLEKIIREMVTKEAQEQLLTSLSDLVSKSSQESSEVLQKIVEIVESVRTAPTSQALVRHRNNRRRSSGASDVTSIEDTSDRALTRRAAIPQSVTAPPQPQPTIVNEELIGLMKKIKDSVAQSGGMTGEVKSLIRELRGEVLGMGRELGRKVEQIEIPQSGPNVDDNALTHDEVARIVQEGLSELRESMDSVIQSRRRESAGSLISRNTVDNNEVYAVVKHALGEQQLEQTQPTQTVENLDRDSVLNAVREAFEAYKPEIELQQFGLERDEILQCLREGLEDYRSSKDQPQQSGVSREEVMDAVHQAMQDFTPPQPPNEVSEIKQEVMAAVRECLDDFKPPMGGEESQSIDAHRNNVLDAVREGIGAIRREEARQIEISPDDLLQAVQTGLQSMDNPFGAYGGKVLSSLHEIVEGMRVEFKQYSEANGRDTEQVLDAMKDGLESLRAEIETYVDRAQDVTGKDEIIETLRTELDAMRLSFDQLAAQADHGDKASDKSDLANWMKAEFENLHEIIVSNSQRQEPSGENQRLIDMVDSGFSELRSNLSNREMDESTEDKLEAFKAEFEQLKDAILNGSAAHKDELLDNIQESFSNLHVRIGNTSGNASSTEEILGVVREEISSLRDSMQAPVLHAGNQNSTGDETISAIKESMESIRVQLAADQSESSTETFGAIKEELENLREAINGSLMLGNSSTNHEAITEAVRSGLADVNVSQPRETHGDGDVQALDSVRAEIEHLRESISSALIHGAGHSDNEEVLEVLRSGLDDLKSSMGSQLGFPAQPSGMNAEVLERLQESLDNLRGDVSGLSEKPMETTISFEILDTLKEGLSGVRADLEQLKSGNSDREVVLAEPTQDGQGDSAAKSTDSDAPSRADIERLEVMLAQVQIKIEALDQNMGTQPQHEANPNVTVKDDLAGIESMLRSLQTGVDEMASKEPLQPQAAPTGITKEDMEALEALVFNVKAKIDDTVVPGIENVLTREHLDSVEALIRMTQESVESMSSHLGEGEHSPKQDIEALALMVHDTSTAVNQIKDKLDAPEQEERLKEDMNIIRDVCDDIKVKLDDVPNGMPSKSDIQELSELLTGLRDSHQALKEKYEGDIGVTAKAFDDRKEESSKILDSIEGLRGSIEETRDHLKSRIKRGNEDVRILDEILQGMEEKIDAIPTSAPNADELREAVETEVAKMAEAVESIRNDHESRCATILEKSEEHRAAIIDEMLSKLDLCFNDIKTRQEEQQQVLGEATLTMTEQQKEQGELVSSSKAMAEELKVTIDTLGSSVQGIDPALKEVTEKFSDDARTVYAKVDELSGKLEEGQVDSKTNHQLTRDEVARTMMAIGSVHDNLVDNHPQVMSILNALKAAVESNVEHFRANNETSEKLTDGLKAHFDEGLKRLPVPQIEAPKAEPITTVDEKVHSKLDEILDKGASVQYDDAPVHNKLDELLGHASKSSEAAVQLGRLDELQQQLNATAAEVSAFVAFQTKVITAEHDNKEKEADQAALDLSNSLNERERIDGEVASLKDTKASLVSDVDGLKAEMAALKGERDELQKQKLHMSADVSSLETALRLRREELTMMDARADALERRIIEGVMDHSRALLLAKQPRSRAGPESMNLKRVSSNASHATSNTQSTRRAATPSVVNAATDMALKARNNNKTPTAPSATNSPRGDRRIASLSQINNNVPAGGRQLVAASNRNMGSGLESGLKRSQSVRTQKTRKSSWQPGNGSLQEGISDDKENESASEDGSRSATPTPAEQDDTLTLSRATSISRPPPTSTDGVVSRQTSISRLPPTESDAASMSRATSVTRPRTNTAGSRKTSATQSIAPSSRRESYSTVVTGTSGHDSAVTPSEYSYASSYFSGTGTRDDASTVNGEGESTVTASDATSTITASTDRRHSVGSTIYSNLGSGVGGGDTEILSDGERVDSEVGTSLDVPEVEGGDGDVPAPLQMLKLKGGPQRGPGPDGYDSGLGSDLPTAALSGVDGSYFDGDEGRDEGRLGVVEE